MKPVQLAPRPGLGIVPASELAEISASVRIAEEIRRSVEAA